MQDQPLVSIGIPTYNRPQGLKRLLECVHKQSWSNLEIIISDNCSTDFNVPSVISEAMKSDKRIMSFRQSVNIGLEGNFNFVYALATGGYFMWMSDDDYFDPNYVEECVRFLESNPDHMLCSGKAIYYTDGKFTFREDMYPLEHHSSFTRASRYFNRMQQNGKFYGVFRNKLLSAEPLGKHIGCDWSFMAKMAIFGKLTYTPGTTYHRAIGGHSDNRQKIIKRYGYKGLKSVFLESYSAFVIAGNIFNDSAVRKKMGFLQRVCLVWIVIIKVHWLHFYNAVRRRVKRRAS